MDYLPIDYFEVAMEHVFQWEGGYVNDPKDPGGETKYGISKRAYPKLDIKNLTKGQAREIYYRDYWKTCRCDELPGPLALAVFDSAVNQGPGRAMRFLQASVGVKQDGIVGPNTLRAANERDLKLVLLYFSVKRALHYTSLSNFKHYGRGWLNRLFDTHGTAMTTYVQDKRLRERIP